MAERQVLWYKASKSNPEMHIWNFLIVNEQREIDGIKQKLYGQLEPIVEEKPIDKGRVGDSDLFYDLFRLETPTNHMNFSEVYLGKIRWDRRLQPRRDKNGWSSLIDKISQDEI
jgi:hypothetical protein